MTAPAATATALPAALSPLATTFLAETARAVVLGVFPTVVYLGGRRHHHVLPLLAADAIQLPTGVRLAEPARRLDWGLRPGDEVAVGRTGVRWPGWQVSVVRQWRPLPVPVPERAVGAERLQRSVHVLAPAASSAVLLERTTRIVAAALEGRRLDAAVRDLVGAGPGLTPSGDDALCGALLLLRAAGCDLVRLRLHRALARAWTGTTSLSASLLDAAGRGFGTPQAAVLVRAAGRGDEARLRAALPGVLALGHSSGADLVAGVAGAAACLAGRRVPPSRLQPAADRPATSQEDP